MKKTSKNCKFWESEEQPESPTGYCHRYAPRPREDIETRWPVTKSSEWCGEWQEKLRGAPRSK